jgi:hypothetical protein
MKLSSTFFQSQKSGAKRLLAILSRSSKNGSFCVLKSKVADQDLKRNTQQIWQSLCVLALLTKQNETTIFSDFTSMNGVSSASLMILTDCRLL